MILKSGIFSSDRRHLRQNVRCVKRATIPAADVTGFSTTWPTFSASLPCECAPVGLTRLSGRLRGWWLRRFLCIRTVCLNCCDESTVLGIALREYLLADGRGRTERAGASAHVDVAMCFLATDRCDCFMSGCTLSLLSQSLRRLSRPLFALVACRAAPRTLWCFLPEVAGEHAVSSCGHAYERLRTVVQIDENNDICDRNFIRWDLDREAIMMAVGSSICLVCLL